MDVVVEVGEDGVRALAGGGGRPDAAVLEAALYWIDDPVGLLGERPVPTTRLWRDVLSAVTRTEGGAGCASLQIVHPTNWPRTRVRTVLNGAAGLCTRVAAVPRDRWTPARARRRLPRWGAPALALLGVLTVGFAAAVVVRGGGVLLPPAGGGVLLPPVTLVEGPMAVLIPADWTVQRRTDGPGSPRVRVGSPADPQAAVNLTWSYAPQDTLEHAEAVLRRAAAVEPPGVFEFEAPAPAEGRAAVRYRENRPGLLVRWTVLIEGVTRIAVGCQSAPERQGSVSAVCAQAVRSAREVG